MSTRVARQSLHTTIFVHTVVLRVEELCSLLATDGCEAKHVVDSISCEHIMRFDPS